MIVKIFVISLVLLFFVVLFIIERTIAHHSSETSVPLRAIKGLPNDELSRAIRLLIDEGYSRNRVMELMTIPGDRTDQLNHIKKALGE